MKIEKWSKDKMIICYPLSKQSMDFTKLSIDYNPLKQLYYAHCAPKYKNLLNLM